MIWLPDWAEPTTSTAPGGSCCGFRYWDECSCKTSPGRFYRILPQGWGLVARNTGEFAVTEARDAPRVDIAWTRIAPTFRARNAFATAWSGSLEALLDATRTKGRVTVDASALASGTVRYQISW